MRRLHGIADRGSDSEFATGTPREFTTTHWSVVLEAGEDGNVVGIHYACGRAYSRHTEGRVVLEATTYIQRVNTSGGVAPPIVQQPGQEMRVPYTVEYFFYREK